MIYPATVYVSKQGSFWQCLKINKTKNIIFSRAFLFFQIYRMFFRKYCFFWQILYFFAHFLSILTNHRLLNQQVGSRIEILFPHFKFKITSTYSIWIPESYTDAFHDKFLLVLRRGSIQKLLVGGQREGRGSASLQAGSKMPTWLTVSPVYKLY